MEQLSPFIKWSGGKQSQTQQIVSYLPKNFNTYYEPFLGGGAMLGYLQPKKAICGDINQPLIMLWELIKQKPDLVIKKYKKNWSNLQKSGHRFFYKKRGGFNRRKSPDDLLFLSRTCVNGLIRYNRDGEFNNSFHYTRKGMHPDRLTRVILKWSAIIKNHQFFAADYRKTTKRAREGDFIYLDPPYFNTRGRYFGNINFGDFVDYLSELNSRGIKFALSYDGMRADKKYPVNMPKNIYKRHVLIHSGNSTFRKVQDKKIEKVHESLYLNY